MKLADFQIWNSVSHWRMSGPKNIRCTTNMSKHQYVDLKYDWWLNKEVIVVKSDSHSEWHWWKSLQGHRQNILCTPQKQAFYKRGDLWNPETGHIKEESSLLRTSLHWGPTDTLYLARPKPNPASFLSNLLLLLNDTSLLLNSPRNSQSF